MSQPSISAAPPTTAAPSAWLRHLGGLAAAAVLLANGQAATIADMIAVWAAAETYSYAWAVLPAAGFVAWWHRGRLYALRPHASWWGVALAAVAGLLWLGGEVVQIAVARHAGLALGLGAIVFAAIGRDCARALLPALLLLAFLVPAGDLLLLPLRVATAGFVELYATAAAVPYTREGFTLTLDAFRYVVVDDCAGLPFVLMGAFVGAVFGALNGRSVWRVLAFGMLGALLGVLGNGGRVIAIVASDQVNGTQMTLSGHRVYELIALATVFGGLLLAHAWVRAEPESRRAATAAQTSGGWARPLGLPILAALALAAGPWLTAADLPQGRTPVADLPDQVGTWHRARTASDWTPRAPSAADSRRAVYRAPEGTEATLFVARALTPREKVSAGSVNLHAIAGESTWMPAVTRRIDLCDERGCVPAVYERLLLQGSQRARHLIWLYTVSQAVTVSPLDVRLARGWARLTGRPAEATLTAVMQETETPDALRLPDPAVLQLLRAR